MIVTRDKSGTFHLYEKLETSFKVIMSSVDYPKIEAKIKSMTQSDVKRKDDANGLPKGKKRKDLG